LQASEVCEDHLCLAQHECKREAVWVEHRQELDAKVVLAGVSYLKRIYSFWLLSINDKNLRLAPYTGHKLLVIKLFNKPSVLPFKIAFPKHHKGVTFRFLPL